MYTAADDKQVTVLISLDLSAAFDTVDHEVLLQRLQSEFGVTDTPLSWLRFYLESRTQFVKLGQHQSPAVGLDVGVPQGSVIGPLLFAVFCSPVADVFVSHGVQFYQYADDTQLCLTIPSDNTSDSLYSLRVVLTSDNIVPKNGLQLNPDKSKALIIGTANQLRTANSVITSVCVADVELPEAYEIKVLDCLLDRRLTFDKHVMAVTRSCNFHAQTIRHIRHPLSTDLAQTLACSLILTRLDYCNSVLYGAPVSSIQKLQRVQNNAARIVLQALKRSHAKPLMRQLHWLPVQHRIDYEVSVLT